jgi:L-galactose dehydrogenase/L-glyceraldehyde 3-phosphate reductase
MEYRALGRTGLRVSVLGFGCGGIGGLLVRGNEDEQRRTVERALDAGITYFDTAPAYGDGRSEEAIGGHLRALNATPVLGTKFRLEREQLSDAAAEIRRQLEASLRRLGMERVDLFQLHNRIGRDVSGSPDLLTPEEVVGPVADGLEQAKAAGLTGFVGITGMGDTDAIHQVILSGRYDTVQCYTNALNPSSGWPVQRTGSQNFAGLIGKAAEAGMGTIAIRVLAAGALAIQDERHENAGDPGGAMVPGAEYGSDLARAKSLQSIATELGLEGPAELSYRLVISHPGLSTALVGASDLSQFEDALRRVERGPLAPEVVARIVALAGTS